MSAARSQAEAVFKLPRISDSTILVPHHMKCCHISRDRYQHNRMVNIYSPLSPKPQKCILPFPLHQPTRDRRAFKRLPGGVKRGPRTADPASGSHSFLPFAPHS